MLTASKSETIILSVLVEFICAPGICCAVFTCLLCTLQLCPPSHTQLGGLAGIERRIFFASPIAHPQRAQTILDHHLVCRSTRKESSLDPLACALNLPREPAADLPGPRTLPPSRSRPFRSIATTECDYEYYKSSSTTSAAMHDPSFGVAPQLVRCRPPSRSFVP